MDRRRDGRRDGRMGGWVDGMGLGRGGGMGLRVGFININDMHNNDVGKGVVYAYEAYEAKLRVAAFRSPVCFMNVWADFLPTSLLYISILLFHVRENTFYIEHILENTFNERTHFVLEITHSRGANTYTEHILYITHSTAITRTYSTSLYLWIETR